MTVSERIFKIIDEENMTQKEFSEKTGIFLNVGTIDDAIAKGKKLLAEVEK